MLEAKKLLDHRGLHGKVMDEVYRRGNGNGASLSKHWKPISNKVRYRVDRVIQAKIRYSTTNVTVWLHYLPVYISSSFIQRDRDMSQT
jgi:hypothetical protein